MGCPFRAAHFYFLPQPALANTLLRINYFKHFQEFYRKANAGNVFRYS